MSRHIERLAMLCLFALVCQALFGCQSSGSAQSSATSASHVEHHGSSWSATIDSDGVIQPEMIPAAIRAMREENAKVNK